LRMGKGEWRWECTPWFSFPIDTGRAGRSRTCLPPRIRRSPRRSASARKKAPCTGIEPVSPVRQTGRYASFITGRSTAPGGSRTHLSTLAGWCLDRSATGASGTETTRMEGVEPACSCFQCRRMTPSCPTSRFMVVATAQSMKKARCRMTPGLDWLHPKQGQVSRSQKVGGQRRPQVFGLSHCRRPTRPEIRVTSCDHALYSIRRGPRF
jgi:hypothetical protein